MRRLARSVVALGVLALVVIGTVVAVKFSNGDFSGDYRLTGYFPRAGEGLEPGSEVVYRGVQVGRVSTIALAGRRARVTLLIDPGFKVPSSAKATIEPVNLFGAEQVTLSVPGVTTGTGSAAGAAGTGSTTVATSYLLPGAVIRHTATSDELGDLFTAAAPLLSKITTTNLSAVVGELAQATSGEGKRIQASINAGASLASYLDQTLQAQLAALDSFSNFTQALAPDGTAINGISKEENVALPAFNADAADYAKLLANLTSFSTELARLLTDYHPTIVTLLQDGANPARILVAQQTDLGQIIHGAYEYAYKVASAESQLALPTGSHFVYFATFVMFTDINALVCDLIAPPESTLSYLEPLQQALTGAGSAFTCKSQLAAFDAAQATKGTTLVPSSAPATSTGTSSVSKAAQSLTTAVYGVVGQPSKTTATSLGGYIGSLLGGAL